MGTGTDHDGTELFDGAVSRARRRTCRQTVETRR